MKREKPQRNKFSKFLFYKILDSIQGKIDISNYDDIRYALTTTHFGYTSNAIDRILSIALMQFYGIDKYYILDRSNSYNNVFVYEKVKNVYNIRVPPLKQTIHLLTRKNQSENAYYLHLSNDAAIMFKELKKSYFDFEELKHDVLIYQLSGLDEKYK